MRYLRVLDALVEPCYVPTLCIRYTLGDAVRKLREARGWTIRQCAKEAGVAVGALSLLENHSDKSELRTIQKVARALGTDAPTLMLHAEPVFLTDAQKEWLSLLVDLDERQRQQLTMLARRLKDGQGIELAHEPPTEATANPSKAKTG